MHLGLDTNLKGTGSIIGGVHILNLKCIPCPYCRIPDLMGFETAYGHLRMYHEGTMLKCTYCSSTFQTADGAKRHAHKKHPGQYPLINQ